MSDTSEPTVPAARRWARALPVAAMFLTRLPIRAPAAPVAEAASAFPLVGLAVGALGGGVYWLAALAGLPPWPAAMLALAATVLATGALHEDGLADMADGLAGRTPADAVRIMRDSRCGGYGVLAMVFSVGLRAATLAALATPESVLPAMTAAAALSRAAMPTAMRLLPPADASGLAAAAGRPAALDMVVGGALGGALAFALLGPTGALAAITATVLGAATVSVLARRRLGGYTGDSLGAVQQVAEIAALLAILAVTGTGG